MEKFSQPADKNGHVLLPGGFQFRVTKSQKCISDSDSTLKNTWRGEVYL